MGYNESPNQRLIAVRKACRLSVTAFAEAISVPRTTLIGWEGGKSVPLETVPKLRDIFLVNMEWLLTGEGSMFLGTLEKQVPVNENQFIDDTSTMVSKVNKSQQNNPQTITVSHSADLLLTDKDAFLVPLIQQPVSAGRGQMLAEEDHIKSYLPAPRWLVRYGKSISALPVRGDSMEPTIHNDDMVVCDTNGWDGEGIYVVKMNEEAFVKRLSQRPGLFMVISDNPKYEAYPVGMDKEIEIVGRVRLIMKVVK